MSEQPEFFQTCYFGGPISPRGIASSSYAHSVLPFGQFSPQENLFALAAEFLAAPFFGLVSEQPVIPISMQATSKQKVRDFLGKFGNRSKRVRGM